jgi:hypothetical protein
MTADESSLVVFGGMTSSCANDGLFHTMDLDDGGWTTITPASVERRRGAGMAWVDTGSGQGGMMVVGGISDAYACGMSSEMSSEILSQPDTDIQRLRLLHTLLPTSWRFRFEHPLCFPAGTFPPP